MREALGERDTSNKKREALTRSEWELIPMYKLGPNPLYNMPESGAASETPVPFQSRLFATDNGLIGLVPHHMRIIGRAVVAKDEYVSGSKFYIPQDLDKIVQRMEGQVERAGLDFENGVDVYMDIRTLQLMTR
jgi:hypothetical protein